MSEQFIQYTIDEALRLADAWRNLRDDICDFDTLFAWVAETSPGLPATRSLLPQIILDDTDAFDLDNLLIAETALQTESRRLLSATVVLPKFAPPIRDRITRLAGLSGNLSLEAACWFDEFPSDAFEAVVEPFQLLFNAEFDPIRWMLFVFAFAENAELPFDGAARSSGYLEGDSLRVIELLESVPRMSWKLQDLEFKHLFVIGQIRLLRTSEILCRWIAETLRAVFKASDGKPPVKQHKWSAEQEIEGQRLIDKNNRMKANEFVSLVGGQRTATLALFRFLTGRPKRGTTYESGSEVPGT